jgi:hypothetical protein
VASPPPPERTGVPAEPSATEHLTATGLRRPDAAGTRVARCSLFGAVAAIETRPPLEKAALSRLCVSKRASRRLAANESPTLSRAIRFAKPPPAESGGKQGSRAEVPCVGACAECGLVAETVDRSEKNALRVGAISVRL